MSKPPFLLASTLLALALCALPGCQRARSADADAAPEPAPPTLQGGALHFAPGHPQLALLALAQAEPAQERAVELPAKLVWNEERTQRLYPAFAGRVSALRADLGQPVKAGQTLALLASPEFGQAQADTARAQADLHLAAQALARQQQLFDAGIVARKDLEQSQADHARAQAEAARAGARTRLYGGGAAVNQQLALTSSIDGWVVERNLNPGQELRPDQGGPGNPALFVITDPRQLWVQIDAHEAELAALRPGATFELQVAAYPGERFTGRVLASADAIDPQSRTIKVRGLIANPERRLKAEMLATALVRSSDSAGLRLPAEAVVLDGGQYRVWVQSAPGVLAPRTVQLAHEGPREVVVRAGLQSGESVVTRNVLLLAQQWRALAQGGAASAPEARP